MLSASLTISLLPIQPSRADLVAIPNTFVAGQTLPASSLNQNFSVIYNEFDGNITDANISGSANIQLTKLRLNPGSTFFNQMLTGNTTFGSGLTTDTNPRIALTSDGYLVGGSGSAPGDIGLKRSASGTWQLYIPGGGAPTLDVNSGSLTNVNNLAPAAGAGTNDQILGWSHGGSPTLEAKTLVAGANVTITPAAGSITISASGGGGGGAGTVTSFSSGNLSPLFTTSVANATTTPALSFALSNVSANQFLAGPSGGGATSPTYRAIAGADFGTPGANKVLGVNSTNSGWEYKTITAGSNVTVTNGVGTITIAASGGGGATQPVTVDDETGTIAASRQFVSGRNTVVNTTIAGQITLDTVATPVTINAEAGSFSNSYQMQSGSATALTTGTSFGQKYAQFDVSLGHVNISTDTTLTAGALNMVSASAANRTETLPLSANALGTIITIGKSDATANTVTIQPGGGDVIRGGSIVLANQWDTVTLTNDSFGNWWPIAKYP